MPTTNPEKNREYVKASNMKKKEQLIRTKGEEEGVKEYKGYFANNQQKYRDNKKETEEKAELYKKQQAEYMKQYRAKKKAAKNVVVDANKINMTDADKRANAINILTNAIRARKARESLLDKAIIQAEKTSNKLTKIYKDVMPTVNANKPKRRKLAMKYGLL